MRSVLSCLVGLAMAGAVAAPVAAQDAGEPTCAAFDAYEWAQSVYEEDPEAQEALDPDGDGIARPELPRGGAAPALWTDEIPEDAEAAELVRVVDGDTIAVETREGRGKTVRLIGLDTPKPRTRGGGFSASGPRRPCSHGTRPARSREDVVVPRRGR